MRVQQTRLEGLVLTSAWKIRFLRLVADRKARDAMTLLVSRLPSAHRAGSCKKNGSNVFLVAGATTRASRPAQNRVPVTIS